VSAIGCQVLRHNPYPALFSKIVLSVNPIRAVAAVLTDHFIEWYNAAGMSKVLLSMSKRVAFLALGLSVALSVSGCGSSEGIEPLAKYPERVGSIARYPKKGDSDPHPGVREARNYAVHGIDVSKWQGEINWDAVRDAGTKFVFIKATEGGDHLDEKFFDNWRGARAAGIPRAAYHFVYWCRPGHEQAKWFTQHIPNDADALPPVLDVEWNGHSRTCPRKISPEKARAKMRVMLEELEQLTGKRPIIYTDITFHKDVIEGTSEFDRYPFWLRSVAAPPRDRYTNRPWSFWQYTTTGRVPGVRGGVDRNVFAGTEAEWRKFLRANGTR
jgi:lysozyme